MPKPVTHLRPVRPAQGRYEPRRRRANYRIPQHFTNIQRSLQTGPAIPRRRKTRPTARSSSSPTACPPPTSKAPCSTCSIRPTRGPKPPRCGKGMLCQREGITINIFLVPSWSQSEEDIRFAYRLAESTKGRVFFTAGTGSRPLRGLGLCEAEAGNHRLAAAPRGERARCHHLLAAVAAADSSPRCNRGYGGTPIRKPRQRQKIMPAVISCYD